jgi:hypothetical protein
MTRTGIFSLGAGRRTEVSVRDDGYGTFVTRRHIEASHDGDHLVAHWFCLLEDHRCRRKRFHSCLRRPLAVLVSRDRPSALSSRANLMRQARAPIPLRVVW